MSNFDNRRLPCLSTWLTLVLLFLIAVAPAVCEADNKEKVHFLSEAPQFKLFISSRLTSLPLMAKEIIINNENLRIKSNANSYNFPENSSIGAKDQRLPHENHITIQRSMKYGRLVC